MKRFISIVLCFLMLGGMLTFSASAEGKISFADVKESEYYYNAVVWAVENGITSGVSDTAFSPNRPCTRAQVVTFLWRASGCPEPTETDNPFIDVSTSQYYYKAVLWAVEKKITTGLSAKNFAPDSPCTRGQIVTFLWRFAEQPKPETKSMPFADVKNGDFYFDAVLWAVEQNITTGLSATQFGPASACTRGQIVTFLYRYMSATVVVEPLTILFQPEDYQMQSSQEDADFMVHVKGGVAPYTFQWFSCYDDEKVAADPVTSVEPINIFTGNFSDYDFDDHANIGVYCTITDAEGTVVETAFAKVNQFVYVAPLGIVTQPSDYQMKGSQEDAEFAIQIVGGTAPYTYEWVICYDDEETRIDPIASEESTSTLTYNFSDYDFDEYSNISVYCVITDAAGVSVQSEAAQVLQYVSQ